MERSGNYLILSYSDIFDNDIPKEFFKNNNFFIHTHLIRPLAGYPKTDQYDDIEFLAMRSFIISVLWFNQKAGYAKISLYDFYKICSRCSCCKDNSAAFIKTSFYKLLVKTISQLIHSEYITIFPNNLQNIDSQTPIIFFINQYAFRIKYNKEKEQDFISSYIRLNIVELITVFNLDNHPVTNLKIFYTLLYLKSFNYTYLNDRSEKMSYMKTPTNFIVEKTGICKRSLMSYIGQLSEELLTKVKVKNLIFYDKFGNKRFFNNSNIYICNYFDYYEGIEDDIRANEDKLYKSIKKG